MSDRLRTFVAGHRGLVGSALVRRLSADDAHELVLRSRDELDLTDQHAVGRFFSSEKIDIVYLAAARVGGIHANNSFPADFIRENLQLQTNVIHAAWQTGVRKLLFLGSSCIYPRASPQPMREEYLLSGPLEPTNQWYAIAKIAGIKMCQAYRRQYNFNTIAVMPTNLYGPGDNFDLQGSHVLPALLRKCHEAKVARQSSVEIWGTGEPRREFLHVDDLADACRYLMENYDEGELINVGVGHDISIVDLATEIASIVGYEGEFAFNPSMPDGTPRKLLDVSKLTSLGWQASIDLKAGLKSSYEWFLDNVDTLRR